MATYAEIWTLFEDPTLQQRVAVAVIIAANTVKNENEATTNHANRIKWAKKVLADPNAAKDDMLKVVLAANSGLTLAQLTGASDAAIQAAVDAAINVFADGT